MWVSCPLEQSDLRREGLVCLEGVAAGEESHSLQSRRNVDACAQPRAPAHWIILCIQDGCPVSFKHFQFDTAGSHPRGLSLVKLLDQVRLDMSVRDCVGPEVPSPLWWSHSWGMWSLAVWVWAWDQSVSSVFHGFCFQLHFEFLP